VCGKKHIITTGGGEVAGDADRLRKDPNSNSKRKKPGRSKRSYGERGGRRGVTQKPPELQKSYDPGLILEKSEDFKA